MSHKPIPQALVPLAAPGSLIAHLATPKPQGAGVTQIADLADCSVAMASRVVSGKRRPNLKIRMAVEMLFKRPWDELAAPLADLDAGGEVQ